MAIDPSAVWDFAREVVGAARPDRGRTLATVTRIGADGTVWVTTGDGGEAPAGSVAAGVSVGDTVTLEWDGSAMGIRGNVSNPSPAGSVIRRAVERTRSVADAAQKVADAVNQHFFADTHGIHVTEATQEEWDESHSGANVLINSIGQLFRDGLNNLLTLTTEGNARALTIWDGLGNAAANVRAVFGETITLGNAASGSVVTIDSDSMDMVHGTTEMLHFGYGLGAAQTGTANAPYYTIGMRAANSTVGNYSVAEGRDSTASAAYSHAEGLHATASGSNAHAEGLHATASGMSAHAEGDHATASGMSAHAEGNYTTASAMFSHAEGSFTTASNSNAHAEGSLVTASGVSAHAEGEYTTASGNYSHAQNRETVAASESQTALGRYNVADANNTYTVIVGNGTDDNARSNALTVDWDGVVDCGGIAPKWATASSFFTSLNSGWANDATYTQLAYSPTLRRVVGRIKLQSTAAHSAGNNAIGTVAAAYRPYIRALCTTTTNGAYRLFIDADGTATMVLGTATTTATTDFYLAVDYTVA